MELEFNPEIVQMGFGVLGEFVMLYLVILGMLHAGIVVIFLRVLAQLQMVQDLN
jgi:hypothetical protein